MIDREKINGNWQIKEKRCDCGHYAIPMNIFKIGNFTRCSGCHMVEMENGDKMLFSHSKNFDRLGKEIIRGR